jgi:PKD repeat protein
MKKALALALSLFLFPHISEAQKWTDMMRDTNANFYDIVKEFDAYWKGREVEKGKGYKAFKRWQWFVEPRVYPSGNMRMASRTYALEKYVEFMTEQATHQVLSPTTPMSATTASWIPLGPFGSPVGGDAGRVQVITLHPSLPGTFYVGAAAGGFWMTNNSGVSYTTTTDQLGSCGVSDIAINSLNPNIIYIATGDRDAGDTHSIGVLKSTDGGLTWNPTGLSWITSQQRRIYRLLINPINPNTLIAATTVGIFRSLNAGTTWSLVSAGAFADAEYRPGDTTTVYAVTNGSFSRSTNGGASFSGVTISNGLNSNRLSMAVTPGNTNYIYILVSNTNNGFGGLYRSTNAGNNFSLMSSAPNIFDWSANGSGTGGQGWYDIAIDASPTNPDEIVAGGVNSWKSTNGGANWTLNTHWTGSGGRPYVHADLHYVKYASGSICYLGTDGGVSRTTNGGLGYTTINGNMNIAQMYKMGLSASNAGRIITGHQDNGTNLSNATSWSEILGGDGMDCFIDWNNNNVMVGSIQYGEFRRSTNGGASWANITNGLNGTGPWVSPIVQDPVSPSTYYCGYQNVYKSTNQGTTWTQISNINTSLDEIKVSPSNPSIIYVTSSGGVWKTINGGTTWSNITSGISVNLGQITDLALDNTNPNNIYVTMSGYSAGNKVFVSHDGGGTWSNYSAGLPNIPVNCILYVKNSPQALYVGTDVGVYYREGSMSAWIPYFNGLPNVVVDDLEIYYPSGKLRAATYARGVWETDVYSDPASAPTAGFYTTFSSGCINLPLQLNDVSSNNPTAWNWQFPGGSPATSTLQNPSVTYTAAGIYTVNLSVSNVNGPGPAFTSTVQVVGIPTVSPISASVCLGQTGVIGVNTNANVVNWSTGQIGQSINVIAPTNSVYTFTASAGACNAVGTASLFVSTQVPQTPIIYPMQGYLTTTVVANTYSWYFNSGATPISTSPTCALTQDGYYSVWVANGNCQASSPVYLYSTVSLSEKNTGAHALTVMPNPVKDELRVSLGNQAVREVEVRVLNNLGQVVFQQTLKTSAGGELKLSVDRFAQGIYYLDMRCGEDRYEAKFVKE